MNSERRGAPAGSAVAGCAPLRGALLCGLLATLLAAGGARAATLLAAVRDDSGRPVRDAVVLAMPLDGSPGGKPTREIIDQIDKEFVPYVKPILVGSSVSFPNRDKLRHHVYSVSPAKPFELPLYAGTPSSAVLFDKPGVVTLGCNIHDWMIAYVYVAETPHFAVSAHDGSARIANLPSGRYAVRIWHPEMTVAESSTVQQIAVGRDGETQVSWTLKLTPILRPRRAPAAGAHGYH